MTSLLKWAVSKKNNKQTGAVQDMKFLGILKK